MKTITVVLAAVMLVLVGCATQKEWVPMGGSRADGTVQVGFNYGGFESPHVNMDQGLEVAKKRCLSWGYKGAEAFGGMEKKCIEAGSLSCAKWYVSVDFQCTGTQEK